MKYNILQYQVTYLKRLVLMTLLLLVKIIMTFAIEYASPWSHNGF